LKILDLHSSLFTKSPISSNPPRIAHGDTAHFTLQNGGYGEKGYEDKIKERTTLMPFFISIASQQKML
jgi:hypothetical protein